MKKILLAVLVTNILAIPVAEARNVVVNLKKQWPVVKQIKHKNNAPGFLAPVTPKKIAVSAKKGDTLIFKVQDWDKKDKDVPYYRIDCVRSCDLKAYAGGGYRALQDDELSKVNILKLNSTTKPKDSTIAYSFTAQNAGSETLNFFSQSKDVSEQPKVIVELAIAGN